MNQSVLVANRYKIINKIASGGMADVYLAQDTKLDRKVAVKILAENYAQNKNFVARFKHEAQILAKLNHPNIVMVYDWGQYNGSYFICMEYIEGYSLKEIIDRRGIILPREAARYGIQICQALEAAHSNSLIHRDIKPQNILITLENTVKVTDFGIAKEAIDDATKTMNIIGTANYISPEQAMGKSLDARSDIYSLGVVLYEMITADLPFRGESSVDISLKHINEIPAKPSLMVPDIPLPLERIVMRCLQKDRENRYPSISHLKKDLFRYLEARPLSIDQVSLKKTGLRSRWFRKTVGPLKVLDLILMAATLILAITTIFFALNFIKIKSYNEPYQLPDLAGMDYSTVRHFLSENKIEIEAEYQYNETITEDTIISQKPTALTMMDGPGTVNVVVSQGPEPKPITVPNLIGLSMEEAKDIINSLQLEVGIIDEETSSPGSDTKIIGQEPSYGQIIEKGSEINVTIGTGPQMVTIPNIIGEDYPYVASQLQSLGLNLDTEMVTHYSYTPGSVIETLPQPGSAVEIGSIVKIYIATNQEMVNVPNLYQMNLTQAAEALGSITLKYEVKEITSAYSVQKGLILFQYPAAGDSVFLNSTVIIFIGN